MVEFEPGDSKAILRLLHPFQTEMFAEMTEEWCLLFLQSKSESVQDVTRHRWGLWTYVTVTCFVHAGACAILLKWASQVAGSLGVWRSLEARFLGMEEAPSSNLGTSTIEFKREASLNKGNLSNPIRRPFGRRFKSSYLDFRDIDIRRAFIQRYEEKFIDRGG